MTEQALEGLRDHRLRRPQRRACSRRRPGSSTRTSSASSSIATSRSAGTRGGSARSGTSATTSTSAQAWDKRLGLGRKKIFEVRKLYNDVTFIDEFFTADFCREQQVLLVRLNERTGNYEIDTREFKKVKEKLLFQLTNFGHPFIFVEDAQLREPRRAPAPPQPRGHRPADRPRPRHAGRARPHLAPPGEPAHRRRGQAEALPLRRQGTDREVDRKLTPARH